MSYRYGDDHPRWARDHDFWQPSWLDFDRFDFDRLHDLFEPAQALAERRLGQSQGICGTSEMPVLSDGRKILDVAQLLLHNRIS